MDEGGEPSKRIIIPKGTLDPGQNNIIEIPETCEDSSVLIARLQAKFNKPPRYYPPKTNPENKFERKVGDYVVGFGMPPCSPIEEERRNYQYSLSDYGSPKPVPYQSYEPSYFGTDTAHGSQSFSGKFDYCPSSTPKPTRANVTSQFPSPNLSPIRVGRDIFAPDPSVYRSAFTPTRSPPRAPSPISPGMSGISPLLSSYDSSRGASAARARSPTPPRTPPQRVSPRSRLSSPDSSCSMGDISNMMSFNSSRGRRSPPPGSPPPRAPPAPSSEKSCSFGDISDMMSFDASRGLRTSIDYTPESIRGMSQIYRNAMATPSTPVPIPEELQNSIISNSMEELEYMELNEMSLIQDRMRKYQDARRQLVLSIISLQEAQVPTD